MSWLSEHITISDFVGEYQLSVQNHDTFVSVIESVSEKILTSLLGCQLYDDFIDDIATNEHYQKLRDGDNYTNSQQITLKYKGIKSFLVPFIYSVICGNVGLATQRGMIIPVSDNAESVNEFSAKIKSIRIYNKAVSLYANCYSYLYTKKENFENWYFVPITIKRL